jgi:hypothetical protein
MAKPNYSFEKRQRELAKKKKKEEKAREKADRKSNPGQGGEAPADGPAGNDSAAAEGRTEAQGPAAA